MTDQLESNASLVARASAALTLDPQNATDRQWSDLLAVAIDMRNRLALRKMIRMTDVLKVVPLSKSTIYDRMGAGTFPRSKDLGGGVVAWYEDEVSAWQQACPDTGNEGPK